MNDSGKQLVSEILSQKEIRRYVLQISLPDIGLTGQEKIKQAKILVIGAGGKGTSVLQNLATVGVGKLGISDNYPIEESQLSRQHFYGNGDIGKQKAIVSKQKLMEINPLVNYELHNVCLSEQNIEIICKNYDILIDTTDNFPAHFLINDASIKLGKPMIFGTAINPNGLVSVFNYKGGPSFKSLYPTVPKYENKPQLDGLLCQSSLLNIIGAIIANETIKLILGHDSLLSGNLLKFDAMAYSIAFETIIKNPQNFL
jgi:adenylyltransferase/sulfurtransferase